MWEETQAGFSRMILYPRMDALNRDIATAVRGIRSFVSALLGSANNILIKEL